MAERRMFAKTIIDSDAFLEMPMSARLLYYDLSMRADDDGFNNSPRKVMRTIGATNDDINILIARKFIIPFDNGVVVIKHWRIHNYIRKDTYNETPYKEQKELLEYDENKAYRLKCTERIQSVDEPLTQVRLVKDSLDKDSLGQGSVVKDTSSLPTLQQIKEYVSKHSLNVDPDRFFSYYSKTNWKTTKGNPVNWQDKLKEWNNTETKKEDKPQKSSNPFLNALKNGDVGND